MTVGIVEDHALVRETVRKICTDSLQVTVAFDAQNGSEAVSSVLLTQPDILILDLGLPDFDGCEVLHRIHLKEITPRVLILSGYCNRYIVFRLKHLGIQGFLDKQSTSLNGIRNALLNICSSGTHFSDSFTNIIAQGIRDPIA